MGVPTLAYGVLVLSTSALTAFAMAGDADKAREAGADDYLSKPVLIKALLEKVVSLLGDAP